MARFGEFLVSLIEPRFDPRPANGILSSWLHQQFHLEHDEFPNKFALHRETVRFIAFREGEEELQNVKGMRTSETGMNVNSVDFICDRMEEHRCAAQKVLTVFCRDRASKQSNTPGK